MNKVLVTRWRDNHSIGDLADVEGLYRLEGPILPPNLMMMLNSQADKIIDKNRIQPKSGISNLKHQPNHRRTEFFENLSIRAKIVLSFGQRRSGG